ncbi:hypothetical protein [Sphingobacterium puteale]|uniref:hypothetical protein n=1 Tax=Sphingobacterium puteale TaxID=2420510 RepID=UPI003D97552E
MNNLIFAAFLLCKLISSNPDSQASIWQAYNQPKSPNEVYRSTSKDSTIVPFLWRSIAKKSLDDLIINAKIIDSLSSKSDAPEPSIYSDDNMIVICSSWKNYKINDCTYQVATFWANHGAEINIDDGYKFFYVKSIGIIQCMHVIIPDPSVAWAMYTLKDVRSKDSNSIVDIKQLNKLIENITF